MNNIENKERFREFAIKNGFADYCVIDNDTFSELSLISGCFRGERKWIVYDTDERGRPFNVEEYTLSIDAYHELARRFGFYFDII